MPQIRLVNDASVNKGSSDLARFYKNVYSQGGEDGILSEIFKIAGTKNKWCVEFGAWDGVFLSNTCHLIRDHGWSAVLIEGNQKRCGEIRQNHPDEDRVHVAHRWVGFNKGTDTIDDILADTPIPSDFDLLSIDVDGIDWHIWESVVDYRPRVVVIEFNPTIPNNVVFIQDRDMGINEGNSAAAMVELGKEKGYELVATSTGNAFFVVKEEYEKFGIQNNSLVALRQERPNYIWNGYNGKIYHTLPKLGWWGRQVPLHSDSLQLLNEFVFQGSKQGRADDCLSRTENGEEDLDTADGVLRELQYLRANKKFLDQDVWERRSARAWAASSLRAIVNDYKAREQGQHGGTGERGATALNTADDILREIRYLRGNRQNLKAEEFKQRQKAAWAAAASWAKRRRGWQDVPSDYADQGQTEIATDAVDQESSVLTNSAEQTALPSDIDKQDADLDLAAGVVRELYFLRANKKTMELEEWDRRQSRAWAAARFRAIALDYKAIDDGQDSEPDERGARDLENADDILRELRFLRGNRATLGEAEFLQRNRSVWAAAKALAMTRRGLRAVPPEVDGDSDAPA